MLRYLKMTVAGTQEIKGKAGLKRRSPNRIIHVTIFIIIPQRTKLKGGQRGPHSTCHTLISLQWQAGSEVPRNFKSLRAKQWVPTEKSAHQSQMQKSKCFSLSVKGNEQLHINGAFSESNKSYN